MARNYEFWTHGVATILESPELAELVSHAGDVGTVVEQEANTSAWFHIPIPCPTIMEDTDMIKLRHLGLKAKTNENARVDLVHVRKGTDLVFEKSVSFTNTTINETFTLDPIVRTAGAGITMCVHVQFLTGTPRGRIEFHGAGANFIVTSF